MGAWASAPSLGAHAWRRAAANARLTSVCPYGARCIPEKSRFSSTSARPSSCGVRKQQALRREGDVCVKATCVPPASAPSRLASSAWLVRTVLRFGRSRPAGGVLRAVPVPHAVGTSLRASFAPHWQHRRARVFRLAPGWRSHGAPGIAAYALPLRSKTRRFPLRSDLHVREFCVTQRGPGLDPFMDNSTLRSSRPRGLQRHRLAHCRQPAACRAPPTGAQSAAPSIGPSIAVLVRPARSAPSAP